ncbi:MAG: flagellar protein FlgN [Bacteroidetes bacterium]|nr:flagellar protein FlgN [Bacteroidota bacterium]
MSTQHLIDSMKAQAENLDQLIQTLEDQKLAITKNDYAALEKTISSEQMLLRKLQDEEKIRVEAVKEIGKKFNLGLTDYSLDKMIDKGKNLFGKETKELLQLRNVLKEKADSVKDRNTQLRDIVEFSRGLIKETLLIAAGSNKHLLVNKRV